jgi:hypothetical protein
MSQYQALEKQRRRISEHMRQAKEDFGLFVLFVVCMLSRLECGCVGQMLVLA